jgi:hypothetical protein
LKQAMPISMQLSQEKEIGIIHAVVLSRKDSAMMKTLEAINEAVRNPKHPFRKTDGHPKKAVKHRYERRKIRSYLNLTDWLSEEAI